jgi:predicted Abi (CAAX) family protease
MDDPRANQSARPALRLIQQHQDEQAIKQWLSEQHDEPELVTEQLQRLHAVVRPANPVYLLHQPDELLNRAWMIHAQISQRAATGSAVVGRPDDHTRVRRGLNEKMLFYLLLE